MGQTILAIHSGHDSSVSLWNDYEHIISIKEERLDRVKNSGKKMPKLALEELREFVDFEDIDVVLLGRGYFDSDLFRLSPLTRLRFWKKRMFSARGAWISIGLAMRLEKTYEESQVLNIEKFIRRYRLSSKTKILFFDHHRAHAVPALFHSPSWNDCLLYTADGGGDGLHYSFHLLTDNQITEIYGGNDVRGDYWRPDSLGEMYGIATEICGFIKNRHEGKLTGLAAFAEKSFSHRIVEQYFISEEGRIIPRFKTYQDLRNIMNSIYAEGGAKELASAAQGALEHLILGSIKKLRTRFSFNNIGLSGGVFANVLLNQRISDLDFVDEIFVFPPMGDEGLPYGYALDYLRRRDGDLVWLGQRRQLQSMYWDRAQTDWSEVSDSIAKIESDDISSSAAQLLASGKVGAIFTSTMEYGPRALGARSILIDPRHRSVNDAVNKRLARTEFMPFAPVVLDEFADEFFEIASSRRRAMEFMTVTTKVAEDKIDSIPAVVHVDGTARPQIISKQVNRLYYDTISAFYRLTGIPVLVNTSFNAHEEPIIRTVSQAVRALKDNRVDFILTDSGIYEIKRV